MKTVCSKVSTNSLAAALLAALLGLIGCKSAEPTTGPTPAQTRHRSAVTSLAALQSRAVGQILLSTRSSNPIMRANAVEASAALPDRALPIVHLAIDDPVAPVRFTALATMGRLRFKSLAPLARAHLTDESEPVRAAAMFALFRCGENVDITPMAKMLASRRPSMRGNVAMLLGRMGDASAIPMLRAAAMQDREKFEAAGGVAAPGAVTLAISRLQVAEAIVLLGDHSALEPIRAACVFAPSDEVRVLAVQMIGRLGDAEMEKALLAMLGDVPPVAGDQPVEVQLAAAEALTRLNWSKGLEQVAASTTHVNDTIRSQAAMTLGLYRDDPRAIAALEKLLDDPVEAVRLAASAAVVGYDPNWSATGHTRP